MSGEPIKVPAAWVVTAREKTGVAGELDMVTYERSFDRLRVIVTQYPREDGTVRRRVSASSPNGSLSIADERAVRRVFLWPGIAVQCADPILNRNVTWFIQDKKPD